MAPTPYKLRVRRVRKTVIIDMMVPVGRGKYSVVESINRGEVTMREALENLPAADFSKAPRMKEALIPEVT